MYVIGIDGGGTKTTAQLCNGNTGEILSEARVGPTNPTHVKQEVMIERFTILLKGLYQDQVISTQITAVFIGMSGYSRMEARQLDEITTLIRNQIHQDVSITITNDAITALYSGTQGKHGIVTIAGTGSITYGINEQNETARVGGWGYFIDHSGCGFGIGLEAIKRMFQEYDQGKKPSALTKKIMQQLQINSPTEAVPLIYHPVNFRNTIASLAPSVMVAADEHVPEARQIIHEAVKEMADSILMAYNRLFHNNREHIPIVCTGGLFQRKDVIIPLLERYVKESPVDIIVPDLLPVAGAVIGAAKQQGIDPDDHWVQNYRKGVQRHGHHRA